MTRPMAPRRIFERIRDEIVVGQHAPGAALDPVQLAGRLDGSKEDCAHALDELCAGGLVVHDSTWSVRRWLRTDAEDLFAIRRRVEGMAAYLCAQRASPTQVAAVKTANEAFVSTLLDNNIVANVRADMAFHDAIVRGSCSPELQRLVASNPAVGCSMVAAGRSLEQPVDRVMGKHVATCHDPIIAAIAAGDATAAEGAAFHHVDVASKRAFGEAP